MMDAPAERAQEQRATHAESLLFLEEQLGALHEVRAEGHFSDVVSFAHDGLCRAIALEDVVSDKSRAHAARLCRGYRKLVLSLVH